MTNTQLRLQMTEVPYPYDGEITLDIWGLVELYLVHETEELIFKLEWDILPFLEWYIERRKERFTPLPIEVTPEQSLAQAIEQFLSAGFKIEDEDAFEQWWETSPDLRSDRSLYFAFPGTKTPHIIIGMNKGMGEISLSDHDGHTVEPPERARTLWFNPSEWAYAFDMDEFQRTTDAYILNFLQHALKTYEHPYTQKESKRLLVDLTEHRS